MQSSQGGDPSPEPWLGDSRKIGPGVATYLSVGGRRETYGSIFQGRKTRGVTTNVYSRKTLEKPEKDVVYKLK